MQQAKPASAQELVKAARQAGRQPPHGRRAEQAKQGGAQHRTEHSVHTTRKAHGERRKSSTDASQCKQPSSTPAQELVKAARQAGVRQSPETSGKGQEAASSQGGSRGTRRTATCRREAGLASPLLPEDTLQTPTREGDHPTRPAACRSSTRSSRCRTLRSVSRRDAERDRAAKLVGDAVVAAKDGAGGGGGVSRR